MKSNQSFRAPSAALLRARTYSAATPGNDNATRDVVRDTTPLVADPDVLRYLRGALRRHGVVSQDMADAIADVQTMAIAAARTRRMPADVAQWKAFVATIAARWAVDRLREAEVRDKYDSALSGDVDAYAAPTPLGEGRDPVDTKRYLAVLKAQFDAGELPPRGAEILLAEAEHVPHAQIAAELGLTETAVRSRLFRMRAKFGARLAALGMLTVALLLLSVVLLDAPERRTLAPQRPFEATPPVGSPPAPDAGPRGSENSSFPAQRNRVLPD